MKRDITSSIERMPALEDRTGTRLDAIYGETEQHDDEYDVHVRGEIYAASGGGLTDSVDLVLTVYDDQGRVAVQRIPGSIRKHFSHSRHSN